MLDIEMLEHYETDRAAKIFLRDGFVAVRNVLVGDQFNQTKTNSHQISSQKQLKKLPKIENIVKKVHSARYDQTPYIPPLILWNSYY